jgi:hypothetical protein
MSKKLDRRQLTSMTFFENSRKRLQNSLSLPKTPPARAVLAEEALRVEPA